MTVCVTELLLLGGTGEARALAGELARVAGLRVVSSLAGRVSAPALPAGAVRIGGFGGAAGLAGYLREHRVAAVVDATHPFAVTISAHAFEACAATGVALLVLRRPGWSAEAGDRWTRVPDVPTAAAAIRRPGAVLLTTGRRDLAAFCADPTRHYVVRCVEAPAPPLPPRHTVLLDRGPFRLDSERALLAAHRIRTLVTKDSGGSLTAAKLVAAREFGVEVVMVDRPAVLPGAPTPVTEVAAAVAWCQALVGG